jgi:hypothetical protein
MVPEVLRFDTPIELTLPQPEVDTPPTTTKGIMPSARTKRGSP